MTTDITPPASAATPAKRKPAKPVKTRAPRVVSPEVEAIRKECRDKIKALHGAKASGKILETIVTKRLPAMTVQHRQALFDELSKTCQPALLSE